MYILGLNCYMHEASACLLKDARLKAMVQEERFNRIKHSGNFPYSSIEFCLQQEGIGFEDIEHVSFYFDPWLAIKKRAIFFLKYLPKSYGFLKNKGSSWFNIVTLKRRLNNKFRLSRNSFKIHFINHHLSHAASSFLVSPFEEAAILSIDSVGEWTSTWLGKGQGNKIECLKKIDFPHSLGIFYTALTQYLGFQPNNGEGKVMGLAPYGDPSRYRQTFDDMVRIQKNGGFKLNLDYFNFIYLGNSIRYTDKMVKVLGTPRLPESEIQPRHADIAASLQEKLEQICLNLARHLYDITKQKKICLAGGVALNCVMNSKVLTDTPFDDIFIQPAANDAGTSLGAAYYLYNVILNNKDRFVLEHPYWGPEYTNQDYEQSLFQYNSVLKYQHHEDICRITAKLLAEGKIVGWFQGRMEIGPRALGNRSILADPRREYMKDLLNKKVKHRESFRPFAPSVLEEEVDNYFNKNYQSPFMLLTYSVLKEKQGIIPSVIHIDGTGRLQTIDKETNYKFWKLIFEFKRITGISVILNTSFNVRGQPIVCSPADAIECFLSTDMDYLVLGDYLAIKN